MKKNAVLIGAILFFAGCAHQGGYGRAGTDTGSASSTSAEMNSSMFNNTELNTRSAEGRIETPAAKVSQYGSSYNQDISADSSVRGGSLESRSHNFNTAPAEPVRESDQSEIKADSSVRGGTLKARGVEPYQSSLNAANADSSTTVSLGEGSGNERGDFGQGSSATWESDKAHGSVLGSANWNPSDDLLRDGISSDENSIDFSGQEEMNNDASVGGAASSERGSGSSSDVQNDDAARDLNSSDKLEENISGEYDLDRSGPENAVPKQDVRTNSEYEARDIPQPQVGITNNDPEWRFKNNRAQGVGSAATGEFGVSTSRNPLEERPLHPRVGHDLEDSTDDLQRK
jgi:hypothetical protein